MRDITKGCKCGKTQEELGSAKSFYGNGLTRKEKRSAMKKKKGNNRIREMWKAYMKKEKK